MQIGLFVNLPTDVAAYLTNDEIAADLEQMLVAALADRELPATVRVFDIDTSDATV